MKSKQMTGWMVAVLAAAAAVAGCGGGGKAAAVKSATSTVSEAKDTASKTSSAEVTPAEKKAADAKVEADDKNVQGDVIAVTLTGSKDLNTFNNQSHTLVLVLYQLSQSSVFAQFLETPEGKAKLLSGESFDPSVLARRRVVLQPGETQQVVVDRAEGAKYLGAVAGYYNVQTQDMSRLVPVVRETTGMLSWKKPKPQLVHYALGRNGFGQ